MTPSDKQSIYAKERLTEGEIAEILQLVGIVETHDGLHMHVFVADMLEGRKGSTGKDTFDFLYYEQGQLVGYFGIDNYGDSEKDCMVYVHPDFRRRGIASLLMRSAKEMGRHGGIEQLVLVCEKSSTSGIAFASAIDARFEFAEHEMVLGTFRERPSSHVRLTFRKVMNANDAAGVVDIMAADMNSVEQAERYVTRALASANEQFYLMLLHDGQEKAIGSLRMVQQPENIGIYGFVVLPAYRGKGYGRQLLQEAIRVAQSESPKRVMLEVDVNNFTALNLYLSIGFEIETTYNYYSIM